MIKTYCIFSAHYLPHVGGVEKYTENLARELMLQGNRVIIVTSNVYNLPDNEILSNGTEIVRLPCYKILGDRYPITRHNQTYKRLMEYLSEQDIDYVSINTRFYRHTLEGIRLAESKGIRPVIVDHGSAHLTLGSPVLDPIVATVEHAITRAVKRHDADYYAVSLAGVTWLKHFGINALGVLNNSIDAQAFVNQASNHSFRAKYKLDSEVFVVTFTGRLIPEKGIPALIEAAHSLLGNQKIHFFIAGDGPLKDNLNQTSIPNITFLGRLEPSDVSALLAETDVFCLPSRSEGFSTSLLEAAACSATPLVTDVGGVKELMPSNEYGVILSAANATTIAEELRKLESDRTGCRRRGDNIKNRVLREFSWNKTALLTTRACQAAQNTEHCEPSNTPS